jgi:hypothetical protein
MKIISHRGNIDGPQSITENTIQSIEAALGMGFDVEVDVWKVGDIVYLGHDGPQEQVPTHYYNDPRIWFHCKNVDALNHLRLFALLPHKLKYFWHQTDDYCLVSNEKIWVYPGKPLLYDSIAVIPEILPEYCAYGDELWSCHAICTDYPLRYKSLYESRNTN